MSTPLFNERIRRPTISFTDVLRKGASGVYRERDEYTPFMFRALVIAVDVEGGKLETPDRTPDGGSNLEQRVFDPDGKLVAKYDITPTPGPRNPKNSVRARIVTNNMDQAIDDDSLRTFWPLFPGVDNPSAGELVFVVFEDEQMTHGFWVAKVPSSDVDESKNQMLMSQMLKDVSSGKRSLYNDDQAPAAKQRPDGTPIKQPNRLTNLFVDQGAK